MRAPKSRCLGGFIFLIIFASVKRFYGFAAHWADEFLVSLQFYITQDFEPSVFIIDLSFLLIQEKAVTLHRSSKTRHCGLISRLQKSSLRAEPTELGKPILCMTEASLAPREQRGAFFIFFS